jgi:hypothetical protein
MNHPIDWSSGWTTLTGIVPSIAEIERLGIFKNCSLTTRIFRIEVECNKTICEFVLPINPSIDLNRLATDLNQNYREKFFSLAQQKINEIWEAQ